MGCGACLTWQLLVQPRPPFSFKAEGLAFIHGFQQIPTVLEQEIGVFGWLDTTQPGLSYLIWGGLFAGLAVMALFLGSRGKAGPLAFSLAPISCLFPFPIHCLLRLKPRESKGGGSCRWPWRCRCFRGVIVGRNLRPNSESTRRIALAIAAAVGAVQFLALYQNGRRYAVGPSGPLLFFRSSLWNPPLGWIVWLVVIASSCFAILIASEMIALTGPRSSVCKVSSPNEEPIPSELGG